jgi:DNA protecting protein DprA
VVNYSSGEITESVTDPTPSLNNSNNDGEDFWLNETVAFLALSLMNGIGYWTLWNLAIAGIGFKQVIEADSSSEFVDYFKQAKCKNAHQLAETWKSSLTELLQKANQLYLKLKSQGIEVIHSGQEKFPQSLREIPEPPKWLFVQGDISILREPLIAIVGTRNPSGDGRFLAHYVGKCLPYLKATTVSGLALGIDQIIHQESIRFSVKTIAVIGTGILLNYPAGSEELRNKIYKKGGAIVSEYLPYQSYSAENFVRRNRIQAGLSRVVIPIEWKPKGGTAHTVRFAKEAHKKIICLKLPDWSDSHLELSLAQKMGAEVLTIPGQESEFIHCVTQSLALKLDENKTKISERVPKKKTEQHQADNLQLTLPFLLE